MRRDKERKECLQDHESRESEDEERIVLVGEVQDQRKRKKESFGLTYS